jgi:hypothetical protein
LVLEVLHNQAIQQQPVEAVVTYGTVLDPPLTIFKELEVEVEVQEVMEKQVFQFLGRTLPVRIAIIFVEA